MSHCWSSSSSGILVVELGRPMEADGDGWMIDLDDDDSSSHHGMDQDGDGNRSWLEGDQLILLTTPIFIIFHKETPLLLAHHPSSCRFDDENYYQTILSYPSPTILLLPSSFHFLRSLISSILQLFPCRSMMPCPALGHRPVVSRLTDWLSKLLCSSLPSIGSSVFNFNPFHTTFPPLDLTRSSHYYYTYILISLENRRQAPSPIHDPTTPTTHLHLFGSKVPYWTL